MNATASAAYGHESTPRDQPVSTIHSNLLSLVTGLQSAKRLATAGPEVVVMFKNMAAIAQISGALAREYDHAAIDHMVRAIMPGARIEPADIRQRVMIATARKAVLESGDFVTAAQIADLANFSTKNVSAQPNKWKKAGGIFAISFNGQDYFPLYGLDAQTHRPLKALRSVIDQFGATKDGWGLAYWFASVNGYLAGARPQDVLATDADAVLAAAHAELAAVTHG